MFELSSVLSASLILMMFAMGMGLSVKDFVGLTRNPKVVLTTLFGQLILLPLLAVVIGYGTGVSAAVAVGLLLVALCPSGSTSNFFAKLGRGNAALSVSLTAITSVITVFSLPFLLLVAAPMLGYNGGVMSLSFVDTVKDIALHTLLPVILGMGFNAFFEKWCRKAEPLMVVISSFVFFTVVILLWVENWDGIIESFFHSGMATILMLLASLVLGFGLGVVIHASETDRFTMMLEVGIQNGALAFFIAVNLLSDMALLGPATVYTVAMVIVAFAIVIWRRSSFHIRAGQLDKAIV